MQNKCNYEKVKQIHIILTQYKCKVCIKHEAGGTGQQMKEKLSSEILDLVVTLQMPGSFHSTITQEGDCIAFGRYSKFQSPVQASASLETDLIHYGSRILDSSIIVDFQRRINYLPGEQLVKVVENRFLQLIYTNSSCSVI